jgi:hypothetical protein
MNKPLKVSIQSQYYCPCGWCMWANYIDRTLQCTNGGCENYNKKYILPTTVLEEA